MSAMENVRLIHSVDKISNLRTLVKQDLRELGIKVPKSKKTKKLNQSRNTSQDGLLTSNMFGNYLSFVPSSYIPDCGFVPTFLVDAAEIIEENGRVEGIFRKSGSINRQKELRQQIEEGQELKSASVHDVTALIKQFFRELPEPLLTSVFHDCFVRCYHLCQPHQVEAMLLLCLLLPPEHLSTLRFTMGLLSRLAAHSGHNKMDVGNLAVVLAPNIMHVNRQSQKMNSTEEKLLQLQTAIVELLIHNAARLGIVSESLAQRTSLMTECFGTEDELDASDDNTLEDSKDTKEVRKRRRKRSSSLQGLVSSIGRSIAKLRRSTDGKNNLTSSSQMSLSNESGLTSQSQCDSQPQPTTKAQEMSLPPNAPSATPVVMRKRKASGEGVPFSATKKKAILEQLPQRTALGATPFTPASNRRPAAKDSRHQNVLDTPSIAFTGKSQIAFSATPGHDNPTPRKKLGLFSPSSGRKNKRRKSSTTNLCSNPLRKSGRAKHLFKRLSGGKDKDFMDPRQQDEAVGERLASPTGVAHSESATELGNTAEHSPVSSLAMARSASSPTLHNASLVSTISIPNPLDQGFIDPDDTTDFDSTRGTLASLASGSPQERGRPLARGDSSRGSQRPARRSLSTDGALRRGQPNTITNGLLEGKSEKLTKLRRSFDKSDIGYPMPIIVPTLPEKSATHDNNAGKEKGASSHESQKKACAGLGGEESVKENLESSLLNVVLPPPVGFNDQTMMETEECGGGSDSESDAGFSTISGGTVIHNPPAKNPTLHSLRTDCGAKARGLAYYGSSVSVNMPHPSLQPSTSVDSLLSSTSDVSEVSTGKSKRVFERSRSIDSGKGSLVENEEESTSVSQKQREERQLNTTYTKSPTESRTKVTANSKPPHPSTCRSMKSVSAEDLKSRAKIERPTARSNSMYAGSSRHANMVPNLQICAETHKLLTRAGFLEDGDLPPHVKDVPLPARSPQKSASRSFSMREQRGLSFHQERSAIPSKTKSLSMEDVWVKRGIEPLIEKMDIASHSLEPMEEEDSVKRPKIGNAAEVHEDIRGKCDMERSCVQQQAGASCQPALALKRAEMRMPKHDSIVQIKESNTGRVAANIRQINSSLESSSLDQTDASLHFPNCTSRKRGVSPIRIPTIFANSDKKAEYYRGLAQKACRRMEDLSASDTGADLNHVDQSTARERMPDCRSARQQAVRERQFACDAGAPTTDQKHIEELSMHPDNLKKAEANFHSFAVQGSELSTSLLETIEDVITPRGERHRSHTNRPPLHEATNTNVSAHRKAQEEGEKLHQLRTAKGLTPHQVLRYGPVTGGSKRSPAKPVKRLQSPHSPHNRHSPHKYSHSPEKSAEALLRFASHPEQIVEQY